MGIVSTKIAGDSADSNLKTLEKEIISVEKTQ